MYTIRRYFLSVLMALWLFSVVIFHSFSCYLFFQSFLFITMLFFSVPVECFPFGCSHSLFISSENIALFSINTISKQIDWQVLSIVSSFRLNLIDEYLSSLFLFFNPQENFFSIVYYKIRDMPINFGLILRRPCVEISVFGKIL